MSVTFCVHSDCASVSHLRCIANDFVNKQLHPPNIVSSGRHSPTTSRAKAPVEVRSLVPRGGHCPGCNEWTLWGELIKGCYRRKAGGLEAVIDEAQEMSSAEEPEDESAEELEMSKLKIGSDNDEPVSIASPVKARKRTGAVATVKMAPTSTTSPKRRGRPPKQAAPSKAPAGRKTSRRQIHTTNHRAWEGGSSDESLEMIDISGV